MYIVVSLSNSGLMLLTHFQSLSKHKLWWDLLKNYVLVTKCMKELESNP